MYVLYGIIHHYGAYKKGIVSNHDCYKLQSPSERTNTNRWYILYLIPQGRALCTVYSTH